MCTELTVNPVAGAGMGLFARFANTNQLLPRGTTVFSEPLVVVSQEFEEWMSDGCGVLLHNIALAFDVAAESAEDEDLGSDMSYSDEEESEDLYGYHCLVGSISYYANNSNAYGPQSNTIEIKPTINKHEQTITWVLQRDIRAPATPTELRWMYDAHNKVTYDAPFVDVSA